MSKTKRLNEVVDFIKNGDPLDVAVAFLAAGTWEEGETVEHVIERAQEIRAMLKNAPNPLAACIPTVEEYNRTGDRAAAMALAKRLAQ